MIYRPLEVVNFLKCVYLSKIKFLQAVLKETCMKGIALYVC
jgi:hypothetical protein